MIATAPTPIPLYGRPFVYNPPDGDLRIVHEDDALLVLDKPGGLLTVPGNQPHLLDCLARRVKARWPGAAPVHRLDAETSGLVLFAKTRAALRHLGQQFEKRRIGKSYLARVAGNVAGEAGEISLPLRCDWPNRPVQMVCFEHGREAVTGWAVTAREEGATRLRLTPLTGRSHQLRVHLAALEHPILGDPLYAHDAAFEAAPRLQLHAETLDLRHPDGGAWRHFEAACPF